MDPEKLKEILGDGVEDDKITAVIDAINEETEGLVRTKDKLREQVKDLDKRLKAFKDVDLEEIAQLRAELEDLRNSGDQGDGEGRKINAEERKAIEERATKKLQEQLSSVETRLSEVTSRYHATLSERELRDAIAKVGVKSEAQDIIYRAFRNEAKVEDVDGELVVQIKSKDGLNLSPAEFLADWAKTDSAKEFIKAPDHSGGGARGGGGPGKGKTLTRAQFDQLGDGDRKQFVTDGGKVAD